MSAAKAPRIHRCWWCGDEFPTSLAVDVHGATCDAPRTTITRPVSCPACGGDIDLRTGHECPTCGRTYTDRYPARPTEAAWVHPLDRTPTTDKEMA